MGFSLGAKLVRGAYLEWENERSRRRDVQSPVMPTYEDTNRNYDR